MLRAPILIEIRKDGIKAKELNGHVLHEGEFRVNPSKVLTFKTKIQNNSNSPLSENGFKAFYEKDHLLIEDVFLTATALKWLFRPLSANQIFKPVVIVNIPYEMSKIEVNAFKEAAELASARELIILNEPHLPVEQTIRPNFKIPGRIVYGEDRFGSDEKILAILFIAILMIVWMLIWFSR